MSFLGLRLSSEPALATALSTTAEATARSKASRIWLSFQDVWLTGFLQAGAGDC